VRADASVEVRADASVEVRAERASKPSVVVAVVVSWLGLRPRTSTTESTDNVAGIMVSSGHGLPKERRGGGCRLARTSRPIFRWTRFRPRRTWHLATSYVVAGCPGFNGPVPQPDLDGISPRSSRDEAADVNSVRPQSRILGASRIARTPRNSRRYAVVRTVLRCVPYRRKP